MSQISQKSISGITSITTPTGIDNQFTLHINDTSEALKLDHAGNIHIHNHVNTTGISSASNFKTGTSDLHSAGLNVAYADVDDFVDVGSNIKLGNAGVITATSFVGSGAALTGIDATAIKDSGGNVKIQAQASGAIHSGVSTFQDIDVDGHTNLDNVSIAGVVTATTFVGTLNGSASGLYGTPSINVAHLNVNAAQPAINFNDSNNNPDWSIINNNGTLGIYDITNAGYRFTVNTDGNVSVSKDLDVDGHTNLDNVSIAGVATVTGTLGSGDITITSNQPKLSLTDSSNNPDWSVKNANGNFAINDETASATRFSINSSNGVEFHMHAVPSADSTYDLGLTGTRFRAAYVDTYYGDGSNLTGITQTTINNNADDRIITGSGTANTLEAESNLTWNGNTLTVSATIPHIVLNDTNNENDFAIKNINGNFQIVDIDESNRLGFQMGSDGNTQLGGNTSFGGDLIVPDVIRHNGDSNTKIRFPSDDTVTVETAGSERLRIASDGKVGINQSSPTISQFEVKSAQLGGTAGNTQEVVRLYSPDVTNTTSYRFTNYRVSNGTSHSSSELRFRRHVDVTDMGYFGLGDSYVSIGYGTAEKLRIDSSGRLLVGHTSTQTIGGNSHPLVQLNVNSNQQVLSLARFENGAGGPSINLGKSRASSAGNYTVVQSGDSLGNIQFHGADGTDLISSGASIEAQVDGTPGSNDMPGRLTFATTADGAASPTERLRIDSTGRLILKGSTGAADAAQLKISKGSGATGAPDAISRANNYIHLGGSEWRDSGDGYYMMGFGYTNDDVGTGFPAYVGFRETSNSGYTQGDLIFGTRGDVNGSNQPTERLRITSGGNIQIPTGNLEFRTLSSSTPVAAPASINLGGTHSNAAGNGTNLNAKLKVWSDGTDLMGLSVSGNQLDYILTSTAYDHVWYGGASGTTELMRLNGSGSGNLTLTNGNKVKINAASAPSTHALLNLGYDGGTNTETRGIDIKGGWSNGESKSITFTHGTAAINMVGQINAVHYGTQYGATPGRNVPHSGLRFGKLYHTTDTSTYTMTLDSTGTTSADLNLKGAYRSSLHPAFSVSASAGQNNIGTTQTKITYAVPSTIGRNQGNCYDTTNHRFVAPVDGMYSFYARHWYTPGNTGTVTLLFYRNGAQMKENRTSFGSAPPDYVTAQLSTTVFLSASNYIEVYGVSSTGTIFHVSSGSFHSEFSGFMVC